MPPTVNDKTTPPPGLLPANIRFIVLAAIAALVLITSFFSGHTTKKAGDPASGLPAGPSPNQLKIFTQMLEDQKREAEGKRKQAEELQAADAHILAARLPAPYYAAPEPTRVSPPAVDPFELKNRQREAEAPFAGNIVVRIVPESAERAAPPAKAPDSPLTTPKAPDVQADKIVSETPRTLGSGKFLPEKENGLFRIYEGTFIETTLVNRLDGSFTGPVKCVVSKDLRSLSGEALLIPVGSQLFGEAKRVENAGQTRLAVSFKRLLLPNGYSIDLEDVPGLNQQGEAGLKDKTNNHYLRTFGISGAVGLLGGLALYGSRTGAAEYASGAANAEGGAATTILNRSLNLLPTITIREGHEVKVYLPADLLVPVYGPRQ